MLPQQKKGWTTVVDLEEYKKMTWSYLTNVKQTWEYDGIAYIFRKKGIHLYGRDCGSLKMNHPILTIGIPQHKDKNYGVDLYVPVEKKAQALSLISNWDRIREYAELEAAEGGAAQGESAHQDGDEQRSRLCKQETQPGKAARSQSGQAQFVESKAFCLRRVKGPRISGGSVLLPRPMRGRRARINRYAPKGAFTKEENNASNY